MDNYSRTMRGNGRKAGLGVRDLTRLLQFGASLLTLSFLILPNPIIS
jgi:hypothetical protein